MNICLNVTFVCLTGCLRIIPLRVPEAELHRKDCGNLDPRLSKGSLWMGVGSNRQQLRATPKVLGVTPRDERYWARELFPSSAAAFSSPGTCRMVTRACNVLSKVMWKVYMHRHWNRTGMWGNLYHGSSIPVFRFILEKEKGKELAWENP